VLEVGGSLFGAKEVHLLELQSSDEHSNKDSEERKQSGVTSPGGFFGENEWTTHN
jgi:hypothetical protein